MIIFEILPVGRGGGLRVRIFSPDRPLVGPQKFEKEAYVCDNDKLADVSSSAELCQTIIDCK